MRVLVPDLRYALRMLGRSPGFAAAAIVCLALGIGSTTAIFSVVNAVVFRPLPYEKSQDLVRIYTEFPKFPNGGLRRFWVSGPEFIELRRDLRSWATVDAWTTGGVNISGTNEPVRATAAFLTGTLMKTLGARPLLGRGIAPRDDDPSVPLTAVLSEGLWRRSFGADPKILDREIYLDGRKANVIGVMPASFQFPPGEVDAPELWAPQQLNPASPGGRGGHRFSLVGRLKPGTTLSQARQEMAQLVESYGKLANDHTHMLQPAFHPLVAHPLHDEVVGNVRPALLAMLAAVGFVLLIACGNVANLLLARAEARQREIAVRRAMGASTQGLVRQFVVEGLLLSLAGAGLGLLFAYAGLQAILATGADSIPRSIEIGVDREVLLFTVLMSVATGVFFGLAPLLQTLSGRLHDTLKSASGRTTASREAHRLRYVMVIGETAMALVLLVGAGFMMETFLRLRAIHPGVSTNHVLTLAIQLPNKLYAREGPRRRQFWDDLQRRIAALPGVGGATIVDGLPPIRPINANDTEFEGFVQRPDGPIQNVDYWNLAGHRAFETLGMRLIEGRFFDKRDGTEGPPVIIINERLARVFYPDQNPLGKRIRPAFEGPWRTVVGVVADVKNAGLDKPAGTELWIPFQQAPGEALSMEYVVVKTRGDPKASIGAIRGHVAEMDSSLPISEVRTLEEVVVAAQARPRFLTLLLSLFSLVALTLAALGIYSVMSYAVAQRTNEFGLRMALGAQRGDVLQHVLRQGAWLGLAGAVLGAVGAVLLNRTLKGQVYGIGEFQWAPFLAMGGLLIAVVMIASWIPALRATRVDPIIALRYE
jgi:putative ABC transport system permease protein